MCSNSTTWIYKTKYIKLTFLLKRLGFQEAKDDDLENHVSKCLELMEEVGLDFNHFFRRLSCIPVSKITSQDSRMEAARIFMTRAAVATSGGEERGREKIAAWLEKWRERLAQEEGGLDDDKRQKLMKAINPKV